MPKRKIASPKVSPKKEPKAKKAKVEVDPIAEACTKLIMFFSDDIHPQGLGGMEDAIEAAIPVLTPAPADRDPLEAVFAKAVGDAYNVAKAAIEAEVQETMAAQATVNAEEAGAAEGLEAATQQQKAMQDKVAACKAAEREAEEARNQAVESLENHQQEVKNLASKKKKLEGEEAELAAGLELIKTSSGAKADAKKIVGLMKSAGVADAMCTALPSALGKSGGFDEIVLGEAKKALGEAYKTVTAQQGNWEGHCAQMMAATNQLLDGAKAGAETLAMRTAETAGALEDDKAAKKAKKDAEGKLAEKKKKVTAQSKVTAKAAQHQEAATTAGAAYELLYVRPAPAPEPEPVEEAADAADADADAGMQLD